MIFLRYFYLFLIWATEKELIIARSTGRNPENIAQLQSELQKWELCLWELDWGME